jgi:hypothetical protein
VAWSDLREARLFLKILFKNADIAKWHLGRNTSETAPQLSAPISRNHEQWRMGTVDVPGRYRWSIFNVARAVSHFFRQPGVATHQLTLGQSTRFFDQIGQ